MKQQTKHKLLFEPIQIGKVKLKNRIITPPMLPCLGTPEGRITQELIAFAGRLAKAGAGLVSIQMLSAKKIQFHAILQLMLWV